MKENFLSFIKEFFKIVFIALFFAALFYSGVQYWILYQKMIAAQKQIESLELGSKMNESIISVINEKNDFLSEALVSEQDKNKMFEDQIKEISGTVGTITKLTKTDPELLRKYSKVYFLSENYMPVNLIVIDPVYISNSKNKPQLINASTSPFLVKMMDAAKRDGFELQIVSAYRSFDEQESVKTSYKVTYGAGANKFSADQGYSEHQLGTTVDFTTPELKTLSLKLETTEAYKWLTENAYKFGFILSYPKENSYYQFEPWHWRFVGVKLATDLHNENKYFYDLTQRRINEYLIYIFD